MTIKPPCPTLAAGMSCTDPFCGRTYSHEFYGELSCVQCGSERDVTVRENDYDGISEPLCRDCWHYYDYRADALYVAQQAAFYGKEEEE